MKVVLTADVKDLGKKGELVNVSDGYGKNYLIPRKLAKIADAVEKLDAIDADIPNGDSRFQFEIIKKAMGELLRRLRTKR